MLTLLFLNKTLIRIEITKEEYLEANKLSQQRNIPFIDCLNTIHARNHKAVMISQDDHYLKYLTDIVKTLKPEQIS